MTVTPKQSRAISEIANTLYDFLPGTPHPYSDKSISFLGCASKIGLSNLWNDGSKKPAIIQLLKNTLESYPTKFSSLLIEIVNTSIAYREVKKNSLKREEVIILNKQVQDLGFKIPELWDIDFIESLPSSQEKVFKPASEIDENATIKLIGEYVALLQIEPHERGYKFQDFLTKLFCVNGLRPKTAFRLTGEEIDGSFEVENHTYLLEAKWHSKQTAQNDLSVFSMKVGGKSTWSRGIFISYGGFTSDGLEAFARGKQTNIIGIDGQDIYLMLHNRLSLTDVIKAKSRYAAETNSFFISVHEVQNWL